MAGRPKRRSRPLTKYELSLLKHPPTPQTWICQNCDMVVSGSLGACWLCQTEAPERPKLVWPKYVVACRKVGKEPDGTRWTPNQEMSSDSDKGQRRITRKTSKRNPRRNTVGTR